MYAEINAAIQSAKIAYELVKATKELSNSTEVLTAVNDVHMKLSSAIGAALASQEKQAALAERVRELEMQLRDVEDWNTQMQSYGLFEFPTKALAYKWQPKITKGGEPMHYLCTACVDKKKKTTLQPSSRHLHCPECKSHIRTEPDPPSDNRTRPSWKAM